MADFIEPDIEMDPVPEDNFIDTYRPEDPEKRRLKYQNYQSMILLL